MVELGTSLPIGVFVFGVYVPHAGRTEGPFADDVFLTLSQKLGELPKGAMVLVLGDFNARIRRRADGSDDRATGQWSVHDGDNEMGVKLRRIMHEHDLVMASTMFKPHRKRGGAATHQPYGKKKGLNARRLMEL